MKSFKNYSIHIRCVGDFLYTCTYKTDCSQSRKRGTVNCTKKPLHFLMKHSLFSYSKELHNSVDRVVQS